LERAETTTRLIYNQFNLVLEQQSPALAEQHWVRLFRTLHTPMPSSEGDGLRDPTQQRIFALTYDSTNPNAIISCISSARENARQVREQISTEMWEQINRLYLDLRQTNPDAIWQTQPHEFFRGIENTICLFRGITASTMYHDEGWIFMQMGLYLERIRCTVALLENFFGEVAQFRQEMRTDEYLRGLSLLRSCLAFEAYCRIYTPTVLPRNVADFLILDESLPRSLRFCADRLQSSLAVLGENSPVSGQQRGQRLQRLVGRLQARLRYAQIDEILDDGLSLYLAEVLRSGDLIHDAIYQTYIQYNIEEELGA
jgi:uncharacterized alpha-E superfamily protein